MLDTSSIVRSLLTVSKNLARERAKAFGKETPVSRPHLVASTSQLVVSTHETDDGNDDLASQPRGYFADQFEVSLPCLYIGYYLIDA